MIRSINIFFFIVISLIFNSNILSAQVWTQKGLDIDGEAASDLSGYRISMNSNGDIIAIAAPYNAGNGTWSGHVRIYEWNGVTWVQKGQDIDGEDLFDASGISISINSNGNTVAIGAPSNDGNGSNSGHVRIYEWNGATWVQKGQDIDGETAGDNSGFCVRMNSSGNTIAIGAHHNNGGSFNSGHVRIYEWNGATWVQKGQDIDGEAANDISGYRLDIDSLGNTVAIAAPSNDGNGIDAGHVRIFQWDGITWIQKGQDIDGEAPGDSFGYSLSLNGNGNTLAIGATQNDGNGISSGHVRVYLWNGGSWLQKGQDIDGEAPGDYFGFSVNLSSNGNTLAVGASNNDGTGNDAGHARVFTWVNSTWIQKGLDIDGEYPADHSGNSVVLSSNGSTIGVGSPYNPENGIDAGQARIYWSCLNTFSTDSIISCDSIIWIDGHTYTSSNNSATDTLVNMDGCDSIITLNLTISTSLTIDTINACNSYTWSNGTTYTSNNNTDKDTLTNIFGCDSIVSLNLIINTSSSSIDNIHACDSITWIDGTTYYSNNNTASYLLTNNLGCDSNVTLNLSINNSSYGSDIITKCDSFIWIDGNTYYSNNNTATYVLTNSLGCDSTVTINLTINNSTSDSDKIIACDSLVWIDGNTYHSNNNTATYVLTNSNGCDSVITLDLTILPSITKDIINKCDSFIWIDGNTYYSNNNTATYVLTNSLGCDSTVILDLTINNCDFIVIPNIITPNHDGMNDLFKPTINSNVVFMTTQIYNRWGQLLFKSNQLNEGWNGYTTAGKMVPEGTYFYIIDMEIIGEGKSKLKNYNGTFTLIR